MPSNPTQLPAYIQLRYDENGVFARMQSAVAGATRDAKQRFETTFSEIDSIIERAVSKPRNAAGSLDLGIGEIRRAQAEYEQLALASKEAAAGFRLAGSAGDANSVEMRQAALSAGALAEKHRQAAVAARAQGDALEQVQLQLNKQASATGNVINAASRFTAANQGVATSSRAVQQATLQAGQQVQDVAISLYSGQRAGVVFAQQLPQLAFALSGLENSANATQARIGSFARFLAGPWGLAVGLAVGVAGTLIASFFDTGDAADEAKSRTFDFSRGLDVLTLSAKDSAAAMAQLAQELRGAIAVQGDFLRSTALIAGSSVSALEGRISKSAAELRQLEQARTGVLSNLLPTIAGPSTKDRARESELRAQLAGDRAALAEARAAASNAAIAVSQQQVIENRDPAAKARGEFNRAVGELNRRREQTVQNASDPLFGATTSGIVISEQEFEAELNRLSGLKEAAEAAAKAADRKPRSKKSDADREAKAAERAAAAASRETERLGRISDSAAESIQRISEAYDEQPRLVDRSAQSVRKLAAVMAELNDPKNAGTPRRQELITEAMKAQAQAANAVGLEIDRYGETSQANLEILRLQSRGLEDQAAILSEINTRDESLGLVKRSAALREQRGDLEAILANEDLTAAERAESTGALARTNIELARISGWQGQIADQATDRLAQERALQQQLARTNALMSAQLNVLDTARTGLRDILSGRKTDLFGDLKQSIADLRGARLFDDLFAGVFNDLENQLRQNTPLGKASKALADEVTVTSASAKTLGTEFINLAEVTAAAAASISNATTFDEAFAGVGSPGAANDNAAGWTVNGNKAAKFEMERLSISQIADKTAAGIVQPLLEGMKDILGTGFTQSLGTVLEGALSGYIQGGKVGGVIGGAKGLSDELFGEKSALSRNLGEALGGAQTGSQVAGIGNALGLGLSTTGSQLGGAAGGALFGPTGALLGSLAGGVVGKLVGGLFSKKDNSAGAKLTGVDQFSLGGINTGGYGVATGLAGAVSEGLRNIADKFDADLGRFFVTIGTRDGDFRVNPTGDSLKTKKGAKNFGDDEAAAIAFAISDAIKDGALLGLRASTQRLLRAGSDIEKQLAKAVRFEDVFTRLRKIKDPVGAALDSLNKEFTRLKTIFQEAGASVEEFAQLEELYGFERAQAVKEAGERISGSLRSLFEELTVGDSGLSLRTRRANAVDNFQPLADRVAAGDVTAFDDFADAARTLLDIERQIFGSQEDYFNRLTEITDLTKTRIDEIDNATSIAAGSDSPFDSSGAVRDSIDTQTGELTNRLDALNLNMIGVQKLLGQYLSGSGSPSSPELFNIARVVNF